MTDSHPRSPLATRVLARIKEAHLSPRSRWLFIFENWFFWSVGVFAVLLGAAALAAAFYEVENAGWPLYRATHPSLFAFFVAAAPFLWLVALALLITLGYVNIRRTKRGYRYPLVVIVLGSILASIPLGVALYAFGAGEIVERGLGDHPPFYRPILVKEQGWWLNPEHGLLAGEIGSSTKGAFVLRDFAGRQWLVDESDLSDRSRSLISGGGLVRVVGVASTSQGTFHGCFVFPWRAPGTLERAVPPPSAPTDATNTPAARSEVCKGLRPYRWLHALEGGP